MECVDATRDSMGTCANVMVTEKEAANQTKAGAWSMRSFVPDKESAYVGNVFAAATSTANTANATTRCADGTWASYARVVGGASAASADATRDGGVQRAICVRSATRPASHRAMRTMGGCVGGEENAAVGDASATQASTAASGARRR